ncbi:MAG: DUF4389 domain-containing protein [Myxococcales bacterium]|nr:DUF4389 domain-containing protein [Myxococcales bacterium]
MTPYPVHYSVRRAPRFARVQLLVRFLAFALLGALGLSFGTVFALAYVALPLLAAVRLASLGSPKLYLRGDGPRIARALHWLAAFSAWAGLVAERLPAHKARETCSFVIDPCHPHPSAGSALVRIVTGLPSAVGLLLAGCLGVFVWLWAALTILFTERVGAGAHHYLVGVQRWSVRLLAYQAGLVDAYPPFSFTETLPELPAGAATAGR